jgi:plasmid stability protein
MGTKRKATFYVDESLHKALRLKAASDDVSLSNILNQVLAKALVEYLEDIDDITAVKARQKERGKGIQLERLMKKLK